MAKINIGIPQGTRDFGPDVVRKRKYIIDTIRNVFELYGFEPLETPAMENIDTLMGKYGEEGDKLIFKILNNGLDYPDKHEQAREDFEKLLQRKNVKGITERALKYDLTIPFARWVAMNYNKLVFPFRRYQIQPVWRADRPQKGRYREFYQCDADIVGTNSLLNEVELAHIYIEVFTKLHIPDFSLQLNHRKILTALAESCGGATQLNIIAPIIDKLDKIGLENVMDELEQKRLNENEMGIIENYLSISGSNEEKLSQVKELLGNSDNIKKGIEDLQFILSFSSQTEINIDLTLARGMNYYTGVIFEAKASPDVKIGSIGGGGRYDDLTGLFGVPGIPGVGISFGVDRIYDVMEELKLFPEEVHTGTKVLFFNMGKAESKNAFDLMQQLRKKNISCELFPENIKFDKQFKYAEKKNIPYVVIIGSKEMEEKSCSIKNLLRGIQQTITQQALLNYDF